MTSAGLLSVFKNIVYMGYKKWFKKVYLSDVTVRGTEPHFKQQLTLASILNTQKMGHRL